jgi:hypothetical protein
VATDAGYRRGPFDLGAPLATVARRSDEHPATWGRRPPGGSGAGRYPVSYTGTARVKHAPVPGCASAFSVPPCAAAIAWAR